MWASKEPIWHVRVDFHEVGGHVRRHSSHHGNPGLTGTCIFSPMGMDAKISPMGGNVGQQRAHMACTYKIS